MKRFWIGVTVMAALLVAGLSVTAATNALCAPISHQLQQATQAESWPQATALAASARESWQQRRKFCAAVTDHAPMEQIDAQFRALQVYIRQQDRTRFQEACAQLSSMTDAIADAQTLCWWQIF
jgi:hypothetical protein